MLQNANRIGAFLFGTIGLAALALAQSPGTFTPTGNLTRARDFHTATLLTNGKVLIAGGTGCCAATASAELYDPSTGNFSATGDMTAPRYMHTATRLADGKVLIAGGGLNSAELYDPSTGTFRATGGMAWVRGLSTATLLNNGHVLIAGGSSTSSAELYDPSTGTFSPTGAMTEPGADTATLLPNGQVLVTRSVQYFEENHADVYDPETGTFTRTGDLIDYSTAGQYLPAIPGQQPAAMLLTNGRVLIAGGAAGDFYSPSAEIYDPVAGSFSATGRMTAGIGYWQAAALLPEGKVLIAGESSGNFTGIAEFYDPVTGTFSSPIQSQSQEGHAATLLPDGTVLLSGGWVCCGVTIATAEIYHPVVLVPSPVLFSLSGDGQGPGAILHADTHQVVSASNPAAAGEALEVYGAGLIDGSAIPPQVGIGGRMAEVLFFGKAPGFTGLNQVNVRMPSGVTPGSSVSVRLSYLGRPSNEVTLAVQ